jgi:hypothetical protein
MYAWEPAGGGGGTQASALPSTGFLEIIKTLKSEGNIPNMNSKH